MHELGPVPRDSTTLSEIFYNLYIVGISHLDWVIVLGYCTECGTEVQPEASFCSSCGTDLSNSGTDQSTGTIEEDTEDNSWTKTENDTTEDKNPTSSKEGRFSDIDSKRLAISVTIGFVVALMVAFGFSELGGGGFFALMTIVGVSSFLYKQTTHQKQTVGTGLYIIAAWFILSPLIFYIGVAGQSPNDFAAVGAVIGMVIFGFIGLLLAIVTGGLGYFINKRAEA